ncbi:UNVERIFIED_CONTAM: hypothetical protein PYX00_009819 [Menopon gallinae]|uniref:Sodium channel protein Nach n=1 Tax=Menopon gallinae TaxID=328185 RepID=A0AAW2HCS6_9NEOP
MAQPFHFYSELAPKALTAPKYPQWRRPKKEQIFWKPEEARSQIGIFSKGKALLNEFLESSSIHGLGHLARKELHYAEYLLWMTVLMAAITGTFYIGRQSWRRYQHFPTVISMEKDYRNWNTTFAMATVCPEVKINETSLKEIAERLRVKDSDQFVRFFKELPSSNYESFHLLPEYNEVPPEQYLQIIDEAKYDFRFKLSNSQDAEQERLLMVTENNLCYGVNSEMGFYLTMENFNRKLPVKRNNIQLINGGPLDGEMFVQVMNMSSGYHLSISGPYDVPDVSVRRLYSPASHYIMLDLSALSIISSDTVRDLSPQQRKCRYFDESNLETADVYSYNLCRMQCRADLAYDLCKCIPYFYRKSKSRPYCDASGMKCLGQHGQFLTNLRDPTTNEKLPCGCLPLCNDVHYLIELETHLIWPLATNMQYSMLHYPRTRLKREVIFGFADLLVSIGGTAGLLLGCSFLSFIEIIYYLTVRLFFFFRTTWNGMTN